MNLQDDLVFLRSNGRVLVDVLANDVLPENYSLTVEDFWLFDTIQVVGDQIEIEQIGYSHTDRISYTVTNLDTGESETAYINVKGINLSTYSADPHLSVLWGNSVSEDDPDLTIDLLDYASAFFGTTDLTISDALIHNRGSLYPIEPTLPFMQLGQNGTEVTFNWSQFSALNKDQTDDAYFQFYIDDGIDRLKAYIFFDVDGADDAVTTLDTAEDDGTFRGDAGHNRIIDEANRDNAFFGDEGGDVFVFGSDLSDGNADTNTIHDFQLGQDALEFADGTELHEIYRLADGVLMTFDDGRDTLFVYGDNLVPRYMDINGNVSMSQEVFDENWKLTETLLFDTQIYFQSQSFLIDALGYTDPITGVTSLTPAWVDAIG